MSCCGGGSSIPCCPQSCCPPSCCQPCCPTAVCVYVPRGVLDGCCDVRCPIIRTEDPGCCDRGSPPRPVEYCMRYVTTTSPNCCPPTCGGGPGNWN